MPTIAEIVYHRSFLSSYYLENLRTPGWFVVSESLRKLRPSGFAMRRASRRCEKNSQKP